MTPDSGQIGSDSPVEAAVETAAGRSTVSIIITNYNYARFVGAAIDSALAQTHGNCEIIVVDDGSKDESRSVLRAYRDQPGVQLIFQDNGGQAAAFNTGFAASSGDFILFLDADDLLHPEAVATVLGQWRTGLSRCQFPLQIIDPDGRAMGLHPFSHKMDQGDLHWKAVVSGYVRFIPTSGNVFARSALTQLFPIPAETWRLCADAHLIYQSLSAGPVHSLSAPLGSYRVHDSNGWYREGLDRDQLRQIWRQMFQQWESLTAGIHPYLPAGAPDSLCRVLADHGTLYLYRRLIAGHFSQPDLIPGKKLRRLLRTARFHALTSSLPWRQKLLYLAILFLAGGRGWRLPVFGRWNAHGSQRPPWIDRLVERLKGEDFYDWQRAVAPPSPIAELPLDQTIQFGRGRESSHFLWYGWEQGDPMQASTGGRLAALIGRVPVGGGDLSVELDLTPMVRPGLDWQRLAIDANCARVYEGRMYDRTTVRFSVPRAVLRRSEHLEIHLTAPDAFVPRFFGGGVGDYRPQAFSLATMKLSTSVSEAGLGAGLHLQAGQSASAAELHAGGALLRGWHSPDVEGVVRIRQAEAQLPVTILDGTSFDHVLELEFEVEDNNPVRGTTVEVSAAGELLGIVDVSRQATLRVLIPPAVVNESGTVVLNLVPSGLWQQGEDWPEGWPQATGPGLRSVRLEHMPRIAQHPVIRSGLVLNFDSGGTGLAFKDTGWHKPNGEGSLMADSIAVLQGLWLDRTHDVFLTAVVYPGVQHDSLPPQQLTIVCNGCTVAVYSIAETAEITAVIPPGIVAEDGALRIEFQVTRLVRPADYGRGGDNRLTGLGLRLLSLE